MVDRQDYKGMSLNNGQHSNILFFTWFLTIQFQIQIPHATHTHIHSHIDINRYMHSHTDTSVCIHAQQFTQIYICDSS